jgi:hypothetical protein
LPLFSPQSPIFKQLCKKPAKRREDSPLRISFLLLLSKIPRKNVSLHHDSLLEKRTDARSQYTSAEFPDGPVKNEKSSKTENHLFSILNVKSFFSLIPGPMRFSMAPENPGSQKGIQKNLWSKKLAK